MKISTKGRYALRMMIDIAQNSDGGCVAIRDISKRQGVSTKYLEQIVTYLVRAKLLRSERGPQGGYVLTRDVSQYGVGEILRSIEGNLVPVSCLDDENNRCDRAETCPTLDFWQGLYGVINDYVDSVTLQDLIQPKP